MRERCVWEVGARRVREVSTVSISWWLVRTEFGKEMGGGDWGLFVVSC